MSSPNVWIHLIYPKLNNPIPLALTCNKFYEWYLKFLHLYHPLIYKRYQRLMTLRSSFQPQIILDRLICTRSTYGDNFLVIILRTQWPKTVNSVSRPWIYYTRNQWQDVHMDSAELLFIGGHEKNIECVWSLVKPFDICFALGFQVDDQQYWDNNCERNYCVDDKYEHIPIYRSNEKYPYGCDRIDRLDLELFPTNNMTVPQFLYRGYDEYSLKVYLDFYRHN